jgi:spore coat protein H
MPVMFRRVVVPVVLLWAATWTSGPGGWNDGLYGQSAVAGSASGIVPSSPPSTSSVRVGTEAETTRPGAQADTDFFSPTTVHTAHLTFTPDQWAAMQPQQGVSAGGGFGFRDGLQGPEGARNGVAARQGVVFEYARAGLELDGQRFDDIAVRHKGNGSYLRGRQWNKISLKLDLNKFVKGQSVAGATTLNFQNNITDISWMNEVLAYRLYRDAGVPAPRSSFVKVYVTVVGQRERSYMGLYSISENIDDNFLRDRYGSKQGIILKPSTNRPFTFITENWANYQQTYDPKTDMSPADERWVIEFCRFVSTATDAEFESRIGEFLDIDQFARYFAVLVWIANSDSLLQIGQNYYTYVTPRTPRLIFSAWDQDGSFGNFRNSATTWTLDHPWSGANPFLTRVYGVDRFRQAYMDYLAEFTDTIFRPERFAQQIAAIAPVIRPAIAEEGTQWLTGFDQVVSGQAGIMPFARARYDFVRGALAQQASAPQTRQLSSR